MCSNRNGGRPFLKLKWIKNELRWSISQQRLNHLSLMSIENELLRKQNFDELIHEFACKKARNILLQFECLTWWEKLRTFSYSWVNDSKRFCITYLPFSFDVAECVMSRDEHYYKDTMRHCFLLKRWGPSKNCASGSLKALSGTGCPNSESAPGQLCPPCPLSLRL